MGLREEQILEWISAVWSVHHSQWDYVDLPVSLVIGFLFTYRPDQTVSELLVSLN